MTVVWVLASTSHFQFETILIVKFISWVSKTKLSSNKGAAFKLKNRLEIRGKGRCRRAKHILLLPSKVVSRRKRQEVTCSSFSLLYLCIWHKRLYSLKGDSAREKRWAGSPTLFLQPLQAEWGRGKEGGVARRGTRKYMWLSQTRRGDAAHK